VFRSVWPQWASRAGTLWVNGYAERVIRTIKEEEIDLADYQDFDDALAQLGRFIDDVYRTKRFHSALGYLTPSRTETAQKSVQF
jgi:putative transposase